MAGRTRFSIAKKDIEKYFDNKKKSVYFKREIAEILTNQRDEWRLATTTKTNDFIKLLMKSLKLKEYTFITEDRLKKMKRYSWEEVPLYPLLQSLKSNGYISHYSAVFIHSLTEQIPKVHYVTGEQSKKEVTNSELSQKIIDESFKKETRLSNNYWFLNNERICLLSGQNHDMLGVIDILDEDSLTAFRTTNIERTLIDIAIRPQYCGGRWEVIEAYKNASGKVSINKLVAYLKKMKFKYPYHQCIGYYMEEAGNYKESQINLMMKIPMKYDFYLMHGMSKQYTEYSKKWRLYYPNHF